MCSTVVQGAVARVLIITSLLRELGTARFHET